MYQAYTYHKDRMARAKALDDAEIAARQQIGKGLVYLILGSVITGGTYLLAQGGGVYLVAWGAVAVGAIQLLIGVINFISVPRATRRFVAGRRPP